MHGSTSAKSYLVLETRLKIAFLNDGTRILFTVFIYLIVDIFFIILLEVRLHGVL